MGVVENLKDAVGIIQKIDNIELYKRMLELQSQVFALLEENRTLKEQAANREHGEFRDNAYWVKGDGPYCSSCLDNDGKLIRLHIRTGNVPQCPVCQTWAYPTDYVGETGRAATDFDPFS